MKDFLIDNENIYNFEMNVMDFFSMVTKIIVGLYFIGVFKTKPVLFLVVNFVLKIFIACFLIYRFNSYRKYKITFTELDRKAAYSAGVYIFFLSFIDVIDKYITEIRAIIDPYLYSIFPSNYNLFYLVS